MDSEDTRALRTADPVEQIVRFSRASPLPSCLVAFRGLERVLTNEDAKPENDDDRWFHANVCCSPSAMKCVDLERKRIRERHIRDIADHVSKFSDVETRRARLVRSTVCMVKDALREVSRRGAILEHLDAAVVLLLGDSDAASESSLSTSCTEAREAWTSAKRIANVWLVRLGRLVTTGQCERVLTSKEMAEVVSFFSGV